jgi:hypothetical protein
MVVSKSGNPGTSKMLRYGKILVWSFNNLVQGLDIERGNSYIDSFIGQLYTIQFCVTQS